MRGLAAAAGAGTRWSHPLLAGHGRCGISLVRDDRRDSQHSGTDRSAAGSVAPDETTWPGCRVGALIGVAVTWLGILLAYDSFYWPPAGRGWPVSFSS